MDFEWDPAKSAKNLLRRGFDFAYASRVFESEVVEFIDNRKDHGEIRMVAFGEIDGKIYKTVYTDRPDGARRIISAHRASYKEVKKWQSSK